MNFRTAQYNGSRGSWLTTETRRTGESTIQNSKLTIQNCAGNRKLRAAILLFLRASVSPL
jgi:hypothetical protein